MASIETIYTSAGCNRSLNCLAWRKNLVLYGSCYSVIVAKSLDGKSGLSVINSLFGHRGRVNCVRWIEDNQFVSCASDASVIVWKGLDRDKGLFEILAELKGHEGSSTLVSSYTTPEQASLLVASTAEDFTIRVWDVHSQSGENGQRQVIDMKGHAALDLKLFGVKSSIIMACALDDCCIHIFGLHKEDNQFHKLHRLKGHEGWIHGLDFCSLSESEFLLASCSQDSYVRVWKFSQRQGVEGKQWKRVSDLKDNEPIKLREDIVSLDKQLHYAIHLETVLAGHEDIVYGVQWRSSKSNGLQLLSCSMDKTMIIWQPPKEARNDEDEVLDLWEEAVRVGEVGGNVLGFLGCQFNSSEDTNEILGYSFNGAFHLWSQTNPSEHWKPGFVMGGHFAPVIDLDWEPLGRYVVSVSSDQTTRVHAPWKFEESNGLKWCEIARPQVHGHDLTCITFLSKHRFASGAEEKVVRVFEATRLFLSSLSEISSCKISDAEMNLAQGASVPSLGLSNKAVFDGDTELRDNNEMDRHVKDQYPDFYFTPELYKSPPPEEALVQNTLWPEQQKLYGHGYEIFCLASNPHGRIIASACKASRAEHAEVLLWDSSSFKILQKLAGHTLTVTQMAFSPCGNFLLTVSRDRTLCLFQKNPNDLFDRLTNTDKRTSVHQRIIWSCGWSSDSKYFATCSRDKKLAIWEVRALVSGVIQPACNDVMSLEDSITALSFAPSSFNESYVIAVGLENGTIKVVKWGRQETSEWQILASSQAHHRAIKRLKFQPISQNDEKVFRLASCSEDHSLKLHQVIV